MYASKLDTFWYSVGIILGMGLANERRHYIVMPPLIGWAHTQNDPFYCWNIYTSYYAGK